MHLREFKLPGHSVPAARAAIFIAVAAGLLSFSEALRAAEVTNAGSAAASHGIIPATHRFALSQAELARLHEALAPLHAKYDPVERMLREPFSSPGYHTTLTGGYVHPTRSSLTYAVALLDTGDEELRLRAEAILDRIIALQDQDPASKTYGIWSWFLEEPLDQMSPPDWNWADFCGTALLQVALDHRSRLSPTLRTRLDESIRHAARSVRKRNVGPGYTNIAIMGTYVTLVAAELYGWDDLREYALARWRRFYDFTLENGGFAEYNSPTYTVVALKELARLLYHARDPEVKRTVGEIHEMAWEEIATHWHAPTRQWAGPHSRCYRTLLGQEVPGLITRATQGRVDFGVDRPAIDEGRLPQHCPERLETFFTRLDQPRELRKTFVKGSSPVVGTTWLAPEFTIASINRGDFWNQRRPLLAYWGTADAPAFLRVRFLHDDYDFTAAQVQCAQHEGDVLACIHFQADGGDRHPSLDRIKNGKIKARDLRLRFEFGGSAGTTKIPAPSSPSSAARMSFKDFQLSIAVPYARWGEAQGVWEAGQDSDVSWLDVVLYSGPTAEFDLTKLAQAALGIAVSFRSDGEAATIPQATTANGRLQLDWEGLEVSSPLRPVSRGGG